MRLRALARDALRRAALATCTGSRAAARRARSASARSRRRSAARTRSAASATSCSRTIRSGSSSPTPACPPTDPSYVDATAASTRRSAARSSTPTSGASAATAQGNDQLAELLPGFFVHGRSTRPSVEGHRATARRRAAEVTVDGHRRRPVPDGRAAQHRPRVPGEPRVHAASTGSSPAKRYVEIETTIKNTATRRASVPVPRSDAARRPARPDHPRHREPPALGADGHAAAVRRRAGPVHARRRRLQRASTRSRTATRSRAASRRFPGMVVDFVASRGEGVSYGLTMPEVARQLRQRVRRELSAAGHHAVLDAAAVHVRGRRRRVYMYRAARRSSGRASSSRSRRTSSSATATSRSVADTIYELRGEADRHVRRPRRRRADAARPSPART